MKFRNRAAETIGRMVPRRGPAPVIAAQGLDTRGIYRNLLVNSEGLWAWYRLGNVSWSFKSGQVRAAILGSSTLRFADLAGHRIHIRRTANPMPYRVWAEQLDEATPHPLLSRNPDAPTWADLLVQSQERIDSLRMENPVSYIGVRVIDKAIDPALLPSLFEGADPTDPTLAKARQMLATIERAMSKDGFHGKPLNSRKLGWLIHSSIGLGAPVSTQSLAGDADTWNDYDMDTFTTPVYAGSDPGALTMPLRVVRDGRTHDMHVACLTVGRMGDRDTDNPSFDPWMAHSDRLPFAVEWSATFDVVKPEDARAAATFIRRRAEDVLSGYREHDETPPPAVARGIADAIRIEDEVHDGDREVAVRLVGPVRCAVAAPTRAETLARVETLQDAYANNQKITLIHGWGQYPMYREFIPGEPAARVGHQRVMPAYYMATAVPNASTKLGDGEGNYLGASGSRAVFFDAQWGPRNNHSGLVLFAGGLGSGKTTTAAAVAEVQARRGNDVIIFDPSGPLAKLCDMPALAESFDHIELSGAEAGTLNPYLLVPEPRKDDYTKEARYWRAVNEAEVERRDLVIDSLTMLLPPAQVERDPQIVSIIKRAVNEVGGKHGTNPWRVVRVMEDSGEALSVATAGDIRAAASTSGTMLIFPEDEHANNLAATEIRSPRVVMTMKGISPPPVGTPRAHWTRAQSTASVVLHLAARYAMRAMYANSRPKVVLVDEGAIIASEGSTFGSLMTRGARDSRKTNTMFGIISQNPDDLFRLEPQIVNLLGAAFIGRLGDDGSTAEAACKLLGIPTGHGYEKTFLTLQTPGHEDDGTPRPAEVLYRDWLGNVDKMVIDLGWRPDLLETLDTTPKRERKEGAEGRVNSWVDELVDN